VTLGYRTLFSFLRRELHLPPAPPSTGRPPPSSSRGTPRSRRRCAKGACAFPRSSRSPRSSPPRTSPRSCPGSSACRAATLRSSPPPFAPSRTRPCATSSSRPFGQSLRPPSRRATSRSRRRAMHPRSPRYFGRPK
jgi:hypothetical protein